MKEINRFIKNQQTHIAELQALPLKGFRNLDGGEASWNDHGWIYTDQKGNRRNLYFINTDDVKKITIASAKKSALMQNERRHLLMAFTYHIINQKISIHYLIAIHRVVRTWLSGNVANPARLTNKELKESLQVLNRPYYLTHFFQWLAEFKLKPDTLSLPKGLFYNIQKRAGHGIAEYNKSKLPDENVLIALGAICHDVIPVKRSEWDTQSTTFQRDQFTCAMATLAMSAPNRVAAEQTVLHIQKLKQHLQQSKGEMKRVYYLDWQGSKGYKNNKNHIAELMADAVERVLDYMMLATEPARVLARFYANPELPLKKVLGDFAPSPENIDFIKPDLSKKTDILRLGCLLGFFDNTSRGVRVEPDTAGAFRYRVGRGASAYIKSLADIDLQDTLLIVERCEHGKTTIGVQINARGIKSSIGDGKLTLQTFQAAWIAHIKKQFPAFPIANNSSSGRVDFRLALFAFTGQQVIKGAAGYALGGSHFSLVPLSTLSNMFGADLTKQSDPNIFKNHNFSDEFGITPHQFRHYLNDVAERGGLEHQMINLWSGRVSPEQLLSYLHKTDGEKAAEISGIMFKEDITPEKATEEVSIRVKSQKEYEVLTDTSTARHSTGICTQNLVMSPCEYLNDFVSQCVLCRSSCHIAHDVDAIELLSKDLEVQQRRLNSISTHKRFVHSQAMRDWFKIHHNNTVMFRQLLDVLKDPEIKAGSVVRVLANKNEMRITDLEAKTVDKRPMALPNAEEALELALRSVKGDENTKRDGHISDLLALIGG